MTKIATKFLALAIWLNADSKPANDSLSNEVLSHLLRNLRETALSSSKSHPNYSTVFTLTAKKNSINLCINNVIFPMANVTLANLKEGIEVLQGIYDIFQANELSCYYETELSKGGTVLTGKFRKV